MQDKAKPPESGGALLLFVRAEASRRTADCKPLPDVAPLLMIESYQICVRNLCGNLMKIRFFFYTMINF